MKCARIWPLLALTPACSAILGADFDRDLGSPALSEAGTDGAAEAGVGAEAGGFAVVQHVPDAGSLNDIFGFAPNDVYAAGDDEVILHYDGSTWGRSLDGIVGGRVMKVWGAAPNDVYAVGLLADGQRGFVQHYDGQYWTEEREFDDGLFAVWGTKDFVLAGGLNGRVYKKTATRDWYLLVTIDKNPYATLDPKAHPDDRYAPVIDALWGNDATHFAAACDLDTTVFYRDPSQWVPEYDPLNRKRRFRKVWGPPGGDYDLFFGANYFGAWVVKKDTTAGFMMHEEHDAPEREDQNIWGIWGPSSDQVIFVGDQGRIMTYRSGGDVVVHPSPTSIGLSAVWGSSADDVWIVGDEMTVLHGAMPR